MTSDPVSTVVVGVLYPPEWYGAEQDFADALRSIESLDDRIELEVVTYAEPHERRAARGLPGGEQVVGDGPALTDEQRRVLGRIEVALAIDLPVAVASVAPNLRWVQAVGAGTAALQHAGLDPAGIRLTSNGGSNSVAIAEFALGRLIGASKRFAELAAQQAAHDWTPRYGGQLAGQTVGLIGYGSINQAVAARAAAFGMTVLATRNRADAPPERPVERFFGPDQLTEMLAECDAVIAAAPETPATTGLLDAEAFASMRRGAFLVNVGRGSLIDEPALIEALRSGQVGAAALDVTTVEPLPADDPLWDAPNLELSAHCSSSPSAMFPNVHRQFLDNLRRYLDGAPLLNEVEPDRGY